MLIWIVFYYLNILAANGWSSDTKTLEQQRRSNLGASTSQQPWSINLVCMHAPKFACGMGQDAMIRKFQEEIVRLHAQLASAGAAAASRVVAPLGSSESAPMKQLEHTSEDRAVAESEAQQLEAEEQGVLGPDAQLRASALVRLRLHTTEKVARSRIFLLVA